MDKKLLKKVKSELKRAYRYFGEYDNELMEENASNEMEALYCRSRGAHPKTIVTVDGERLVGYTVDIAIATFNPDNIKTITRNDKKYISQHVKALELIVNDAGFAYVVSEYDFFNREGSDLGDDIEVINQTYKKVELEAVNVSEFQ